MVLEYASGGDLFDYIFTIEEKFPEKIARFYFSSLMSGIDHLHQNQIMHRDLKLENLLIDKDYVLKIADFGLADKFT